MGASARKPSAADAALLRPSISQATAAPVRPCGTSRTPPRDLPGARRRARVAAGRHRIGQLEAAGGRAPGARRAAPRLQPRAPGSVHTIQRSMSGPSAAAIAAASLSLSMPTTANVLRARPAGAAAAAAAPAAPPARAPPARCARYRGSIPPRRAPPGSARQAARARAPPRWCAHRVRRGARAAARAPPRPLHGRAAPAPQARWRRCDTGWRRRAPAAAGRSA